MGSRTDKLSSQNSQSIQSISFSKPKKSDLGFVVGRAIAKYSGIIFGVVSTVAFVTSVIFACISVSNTYIPPICFIAGIISLSSLGVSIASLAASGICGVFFTVFKDKIQKFQQQQQQQQQLGIP